MVGRVPAGVDALVKPALLDLTDGCRLELGRACRVRGLGESRAR
jgi:hypothetical protein